MAGCATQMRRPPSLGASAKHDLQSCTAIQCCVVLCCVVLCCVVLCCVAVDSKTCRSTRRCSRICRGEMRPPAELDIADLWLRALYELLKLFFISPLAGWEIILAHIGVPATLIRRVYPMRTPNRAWCATYRSSAGAPHPSSQFEKWNKGSCDGAFYSCLTPAPPSPTHHSTVHC